jgi:hypothetical protein
MSVPFEQIPGGQSHDQNESQDKEQKDGRRDQQDLVAVSHFRFLLT